MDPRVDSDASLRRQSITPSGVVTGDRPNLCPFGCGANRVDANGYCRHLVGWTMDAKTVELRERFMPGRERTGELLGIVEEDDVLVSGTPERRDKAGNKAPTPSHRVYRRTGRAPIQDDGRQIHRDRTGEHSYDLEDADLEPAA